VLASGSKADCTRKEHAAEEEEEEEDDEDVAFAAVVVLTYSLTSVVFHTWPTTSPGSPGLP
jgi:hypothetical protein